MAVAAYLDSKEEVELDEAELHLFDNKRDAEKKAKEIGGRVITGTGKSKGKFAAVKEEVELDEETVFVIRFEKEGMRFATPFRRMQDAKDGEKILKKSAGVSNVSITKDILKPGIKLSTQEGRIVKEM